jgi:hypothetical protein
MLSVTERVLLLLLLLLLLHTELVDFVIKFVTVVLSSSF